MEKQKAPKKKRQRKARELGGLPEVGFVRLPQVLAVYPIGESTWWAGCEVRPVSEARAARAEDGCVAG